MKKVLILVFSDLNNDARMIRHAAFLSQSHHVTVCCMGAPKNTDYKVVILRGKLTFFRKAIAAALLLLKRFSWAHSILHPYKKEMDDQLSSQNFDLIVANDVETLPFAFYLKKNHTKIIFDAHEYAPLHFEDKLWWRVFFMDFNYFLCKKYIPLTDAMLTIGQTIANEYEKQFGVKPVVITNSTYYQALTPKREGSKEIRLVHHGIVNQSRRIELIIEIMKHLPDHFTLDLILVTPLTASGKTRAYLEKLKELSRSYNNVKFIDPVPVSKIASTLNDYDMGIILAPPINFNYSNGLPNKLFDFIQARIGVITGPTPEIANIVNGYNIGVVSEGFTSESLAKKIAPLNREKVMEFKNSCNSAAQELSAEKNKQTLTSLVDSLLK